MRLLQFCPALLLFAAQTTRAFVGDVNPAGNYMRWNLVNSDPSIGTNVVNRQTKAVRYFIGKEAYSSQNRDAEYGAVRACFKQWQSVSDTTLKFEDAGFISNPDINTNDGTNVVYWAKNLTVNGGLDNISGVLAYEYYAFLDDYSIAEADIVFNGVQFVWSAQASPPAGQYAIEGVLLHEIGHLIGLEHSPIGGATLFWVGESGSNSQSGLSSEELAAARFLYPNTAAAGRYAGVRGKVLLNGQGILGAVVIAEDNTGAVVAGTVSRANGDYELPSMPPGDYALRVTPLDPRTGGPPLVSDFYISAYGDYVNAVTAFLPTARTPARLNVGQTLALNLPVTGGNPAFRISRLLEPTTDPGRQFKVNSPGIAQAGQKQLMVGVYSPDIPVSGAALMVTGDGITHGTTRFSPNDFPGQNLIYVMIDIAPNATPGMRSLIVSRGSDTAYANGFFVLQAPPAGKYLSLTRAGAASSTLSWLSQAGSHYEVQGRDHFFSGKWLVLSPSIPGTGGTLTWTDTDAAPAIRFYRLATTP